MLRTIHPPLRSRRRVIASLLLCTTPLTLTLSIIAGCGAPPSVVPLLSVSANAIEREARLVEEDAIGDEQAADAARQRLTHALQADLAHRPDADQAWILSAAKGYAAAREALAQSLAQQCRTREQRAQNLRDAAAAQRRAISLIQQQDEILHRGTGVDLWQLDRLMQSSSITTAGGVPRASNVNQLEDSR
jgi:hypothetical protein